MKKIVVLIGSRRKNGNTVTFVRSILDNLPKENFEIEYIFPQDYKISPCVGCENCFNQMKCITKDELLVVQEKILESDVFVVASPVYLHYMTADLKLILDKSSWWAHTLRLEGKPIIVLSTCDSNGHRKVIDALSQIMTYMGGNVIATANASQFPNQLNDESWLRSVSIEINRRIIRFSRLGLQSNKFLEETFADLKHNMKIKDEIMQEMNLKNGEVYYWKETGLIECDSFSDYLLSINKNVTQIKLV